jgi:hypothetical protein
MPDIGKRRKSLGPAAAHLGCYMLTFVTASLHLAFLQDDVQEIRDVGMPSLFAGFDDAAWLNATSNLLITLSAQPTANQRIASIGSYQS